MNDVLAWLGSTGVNVFVGIAGAFAAWRLWQAWRDMQQLRQALVAERTRREKAEELSQTVASDRQIDSLLRIRERRDDELFEQNKKASLQLLRLNLQDVSMMQDGHWTLQPGMNVLLGRNGYGKSLLLRSLAGLLVRHEQAFIEPRAGRGELSLALRRDGQHELILRDAEGFDGSIGPVPLLAIPDSRFFDRSADVLRVPPDPFRNLARQGARLFLEQQPYQGIVQGLLYGLCLDYFERGRQFDLPLFRLLGEVFAELTDEGFRFHGVTRVDAHSFQLEVLTEGNTRPIPIQMASQGTLSVLAIFGLIFRFLAQLSGDEASATQQRGIVVVDEIDAHLHPAWQQRIAALLRRHFPNVQFIVSAHSPLLVAGCSRGEVAVMRKGDAGFYVQVLERDFVGAMAQDIYAEVFRIHDGNDMMFLQGNADAAGGVDLDADIRDLEAQGDKLDDAGRLRLDQLRGQAVAMRRARVVEAERADAELRLMRMEVQATEIEFLKHRVAELEAELHDRAGASAASASAARRGGDA